MCVAELNVSILPCQHRWYHLLRRCESTRDLSNCPEKLALEGWEVKCEFCPWCSGWNLDGQEFRMLGNPSAGSSSGRTPPGSRRDSLASVRRDSRRGSLARTDSSSSNSIRNRQQNMKIEAILPPDTLDARLANVQVIKEHEVASPTPSTPRSSASIDARISTHSRTGSGRMLGLADKSWVRSKRWSCGLIK